MCSPIFPDYLADLENSASLEGVRLGLPEEYWGKKLKPKVKKTCRNAIEAAREMGAEVVPVSLPHTEYAIATYYILAMAEASSNLARFDGVRYGRRGGRASNLAELYTSSRSEGSSRQCIALFSSKDRRNAFKILYSNK